MKTHHVNRKSNPAFAALASGALTTLLIGSAANAAMLASDNAGNYTATSGATNLWPNGTSTLNGGTGFGAWTLDATNPSPSYAGAYLAIPSYNWPKSEAIATDGGYIWGIYSGGGAVGAIPTMSADRALENSTNTGLGTLRSGQVLSIAMKNAGIGTTDVGSQAPTFGLSLVTGSGATGTTSVFTIAFTELAPNTGANTSANTVLDTTITDAGTPKSYIEGVNTNALTAAGLNGGVDIAFALGSADSYALTISAASGNTNVPSPLTYNGTVNGPINQANIFDSMAGHDGLFNSLAVTNATPTPEPATLALFALAGAGVLLLRTRSGNKIRDRA
ncbi:MAG: PEP-CTERM sorting domain-containing protein [Phycisphaerae bacterium]